MRRVFILLAMLTALGLAPRAQAATVGDFPIPGGHWYSEANGTGGAVAAGFPVIDTATIKLWSAFQRLGGVPVLGYPVSLPFPMDGFVVQGFQKALLQWQPETGGVSFVNVFDLLHSAGKDDWLRSVRQIPPPASTVGDAGKTWPQIVAAHQALLDANPALKAAYFADPDPLSHYGLPMTGPVDEGDVVVVRCQRAALQQWKQNVPWAKAGQVTVANGGDIAKEAGLVPAAAAQPLYPTFAWSSTPGGPFRVDAAIIALRLADVPTGYVAEANQPVATALPNAEEPAGKGPTAVSATRILGPFEAIISRGLINADRRDFVQSTNPNTATGITLIENQVLTFDGVDDARASYALLLARLRDYGAPPESVGSLGDAAVGAVARAKRTTDGAATTSYGVFYRKGNVTGVVVVYYVGEPGSFAEAVQLVNANLAHLAAG